MRKRISISAFVTLTSCLVSAPFVLTSCKTSDNDGNKTTNEQEKQPNATVKENDESSTLVSANASDDDSEEISTASSEKEPISTSSEQLEMSTDSGKKMEPLLVPNEVASIPAKIANINEDFQKIKASKDNQLLRPQKFIKVHQNSNAPGTSSIANAAQENNVNAKIIAKNVLNQDKASTLKNLHAHQKEQNSDVPSKIFARPTKKIINNDDPSQSFSEVVVITNENKGINPNVNMQISNNENDFTANGELIITIPDKQVEPDPSMQIPHEKSIEIVEEIINTDPDKQVEETTTTETIWKRNVNAVKSLTNVNETSNSRKPKTVMSEIVLKLEDRTSSNTDQMIIIHPRIETIAVPKTNVTNNTAEIAVLNQTSNSPSTTNGENSLVVDNSVHKSTSSVYFTSEETSDSELKNIKTAAVETFPKKNDHMLIKQSIAQAETNTSQESVETQTAQLATDNDNSSQLSDDCTQTSTIENEETFNESTNVTIPDKQLIPDATLQTVREEENIPAVEVTDVVSTDHPSVLIANTQAELKPMVNAVTSSINLVEPSSNGEVADVLNNIIKRVEDNQVLNTEKVLTPLESEHTIETKVNAENNVDKPSELKSVGDHYQSPANIESQSSVWIGNQMGDKRDKNKPLIDAVPSEPTVSSYQDLDTTTLETLPSSSGENIPPAEIIPSNKNREKETTQIITNADDSVQIADDCTQPSTTEDVKTLHEQPTNLTNPEEQVTANATLQAISEEKNNKICEATSIIDNELAVINTDTKTTSEVNANVIKPSTDSLDPLSNESSFIEESVESVWMCNDIYENKLLNYFVGNKMNNINPKEQENTTFGTFSANDPETTLEQASYPTDKANESDLLTPQNKNSKNETSTSRQQVSPTSGAGDINQRKNRRKKKAKTQNSNQQLPNEAKKNTSLYVQNNVER